MRAGAGGCRHSHPRAVVVGGDVGDVEAAGAVASGGQRQGVGIQGEGGGAALIGDHADLADFALGQVGAGPGDEVRAGAGGCRHGHHRAEVVGASTGGDDKAGTGARRFNGQGQFVGLQVEHGGANFVGDHGHRDRGRRTAAVSAGANPTDKERVGAWRRRGDQGHRCSMYVGADDVLAHTGTVGAAGADAAEAVSGHLQLQSVAI